MPAPLAACLSPIPWGGLWTSRHEICLELSRRGWDVLFVDPPPNAARRVFRGPHPPPGPGGTSAPPGGPSVQVVAPPPYLPYGALGVAPRLAGRVIEHNARHYARFVAEAVETFRPGGRVGLLLNSFMPVLGYRVQELLAPQVSVYHRSDELQQFPGWRPAYRVLEERVAKAADMVACVSEPVRSGISRARPDAAVIPNGVDTGRFDHRVEPDRRLSGLDRPISVMVGVFDRRVDQALLRAAASCSSLVMVGRLEGVEVPAGATWLGHAEKAAIPGILAASDVGIVCYRPGWAGDVLKIYEYLAAGLPVVTSHVPGAADMRAAVNVGRDAGRFSDLIRTAASGRTPDGDALRRAVAAQNSWSSRVDELLQMAGFPSERAIR